jgi:anti-anti-sigma regulatory factor
MSLSSREERPVAPVEHYGTTTIVQLGDAAPRELSSALAEAFRGRPETIVVDLDGAIAIDRGCVRLLAAARDRAAEDGRRFVVAGATAPVRRALRRDGYPGAVGVAADDAREIIA